MIQKYTQLVIKENLLLLKDPLEPNKYMTSVSKYVYIDKLDELVNKYSNTLQLDSNPEPLSS